MSDDIILWILMGLMAICGAMLIGMMGYGIFWLFDSAFTSSKTVPGTVAAVSFYPEHSEVYYNVALKIPQVRTVPDQWSIRLDTDDGSGWMDLDVAPAKWFAKGKRVAVKYSNGRITGGFRVRQIYPC